MNDSINKETLLAKFSSFEGEINGQSQGSVHQVRKQAIEYFQNIDFPTTKHEEWKYTNVKKILKKDFAFSPASQITKEEAEACFLPEENANILVFVNGYFRKEFSTILTDEKQLVIQEFSEACKKNEALVNQYFGKYTNVTEEAFTALNTAFAHQGLFLHIPDNQVITEPIILYFISDSRQENVLAQPRNLFIIGKSSQVTLVDKTDTLGTQASFNNVVTEIDVEENAHVKHYKIQNDHKESYYVGTTQVHQAKNSTYTNTTISLDGGIIRNNLNIILDGENIEGNMFGLYMLQGNTHVDNHSIADHQKPHSVSNELYKGVLADQSTGVFNGKIFVRQDAQKTNAYQQNRNILVSDNASINTKPQLEIWADDVKCSHGATTGSLDETALFYLRSRGISITKAKALLIHAFGNEIVEKIEIESIRQYLGEIILKRLHQDG